MEASQATIALALLVRPADVMIARCAHPCGGVEAERGKVLVEGANEVEVPRYSDERREVVLRKLVPPNNRPLKELAAEKGVSEATESLKSRARL